MSPNKEQERPQQRATTLSLPTEVWDALVEEGEVEDYSSVNRLIEHILTEHVLLQHTLSTKRPP